VVIVPPHKFACGGGFVSWLDRLPPVGGTMKSHEEDLLSICKCIIIDAAAKCYTDKVSYERDIKTIISRLNNEGLSFLTITLPNFGKDFEKCLSYGLVTSTSFSGWKKVRHLPAFLQGFVRLVFSAETGGILDDPDISAVEGVRQIAYAFKKLSIQCTPKRESLAMSGFQEVECFLSSAMLPRDTNLFSQISDLLWNNVLGYFLDHQDIVPRHGPGQTAEHISGNRKYTSRTWHERLEPFFPSDLCMIASYSQLMYDSNGIQDLQFRTVEQEQPVRIVSVPKTQKGPRIIAIEPVCMQYTQQGLSSLIIEKIEASELTGGHINFTDQSINQRLALSASKDQLYATIDLSEASDRVPLSLVTLMLDSTPNFRDAILSCRSNAAQMPSGLVLNLKKFASMGSALCFPICAMYYYTVILTALFGKHKLPVTFDNIIKMSSNVYIYGDDIIIPTDEVVTVWKL